MTRRRRGRPSIDVVPAWIHIAIDLAGREPPVGDAEVHKIATSELAVDREIKQREIAYAVLVSELGPDGPNIFRFQGRFRADQKPRVPCVPDVFG